MKRKISVGLFLTAISAAAGLIGLIAYFVNSGTAYFAKLGVEPSVVICMALALVCQVAFIAVGMKGQPQWADILPVAASALLMLGTIYFLSVRVNGIAAVMTFENNASNMADLSSALVGIGACAVATVLGIVSSFFDITKE